MWCYRRSPTPRSAILRRSTISVSQPLSYGTLLPYVVCVFHLQVEGIVQKLPIAALAALVSTLSISDAARAIDFAPAPAVQQQAQAPQSLQFQGQESLTAPPVTDGTQLPEGTQWRYSEFIGAVENGKVERVRFSKDGTQLQLTATDGRRATVVRGLCVVVGVCGPNHLIGQGHSLTRNTL